MRGVKIFERDINKKKKIEFITASPTDKIVLLVMREISKNKKTVKVLRKLEKFQIYLWIGKDGEKKLLQHFFSDPQGNKKKSKTKGQ